jgi:1-acyl-sn-glycerol-3-phosphate acyltransferase
MPADPSPSPPCPAVPQRSTLWRTLQCICDVAFPVLFDVQVFGKHNIPATGPAVVAANHQSYLDPPLLGFALERPLAFLARSELFGNPHFARFIRSLHAFPIQQGKGDRRALTTAIERLADGNLLNIYPEGARTDDGEIADLQPGIALILRKARCPVVPAVLDGAFDAWPNSRKLFRFRPIRILFGPPLHLYDLPAAELLQTLAHTLRTMHRDLRSFPAGVTGEPISARVSPAPRFVLPPP